MKINSYQEMLDTWTTSFLGPGFHGDLRMLECVYDIIISSDCFIETGTNLGNTLYFVSNNFNIDCYSCEPSDATPNFVKSKSNVYFKKEKSPKFLSDIIEVGNELPLKKCFFYLDAHSDTESVWEDELSFILKTFKNFCIVIDDFDINNTAFSHNGYSMKQLFNIVKGSGVKVFSPSYNELTSEFHSLTGWVLITNRNDLNFTNVKEIYE